MKVLRKIIENSPNPITIQLPTEYENRRLEVIVLPLEETISYSEKKYDFSDLVGKLEWKGDALAEQKKLRDEWD